jgi:hypothetical protein
MISEEFLPAKSRDDWFRAFRSMRCLLEVQSIGDDRDGLVGLLNVDEEFVTSPIFSAGTPAQISSAGTSFSTTDPIPMTARAPMESISRTDELCPRYAHSPTVTAPPNEARPAKVTPSAILSSWVMSTCGIARTCAPIRNGVVTTTLASNTVPGPKMLPSGTEAAGCTTVAHRSSVSSSCRTKPSRAPGRRAFATHATTAASGKSPSSAELPSTGTPSRSAPCLLGSSSSDPMGFQSPGRSRTAASTSRASPPPPTRSSGRGVMHPALRLMEKTTGSMVAATLPYRKPS